MVLTMNSFTIKAEWQMGYGSLNWNYSRPLVSRIPITCDHRHMSINLMNCSKPPISPALVMASEDFVEIACNATFRMSSLIDTVKIEGSIPYHNARMLDRPFK